MTCFSEFLIGECNCSIYRNSSLHTKPTGTDPLSSRGAIFRGAIKWFSATFHSLLLFKRWRHSWVQKTVLNRNSPIFTRVLKKQSVCGGRWRQIYRELCPRRKRKKKNFKTVPITSTGVAGQSKHNLTRKALCCVSSKVRPQASVCGEEQVRPWTSLGASGSSDQDWGKLSSGKGSAADILQTEHTTGRRGYTPQGSSAVVPLPSLRAGSDSYSDQQAVEKMKPCTIQKAALVSHLQCSLLEPVPWNEGQASHVQKVPQWVTLVLASRFNYGHLKC